VWFANPIASLEVSSNFLVYRSVCGFNRELVSFPKVFSSTDLFANSIASL